MNFSVNKSVLSVACQHDAAERQRLFFFWSPERRSGPFRHIAAKFRFHLNESDKFALFGSKMPSASGALRPLTHWPGALPLDPAGGTAPRPPYIGSRSRACHILSVPVLFLTGNEPCLQPGDRSYRSISSAHRALSNKPQAAVAGVKRRDRRTDGRTDARQLHRPCSAYYAGTVNNFYGRPWHRGRHCIRHDVAVSVCRSVTVSITTFKQKLGTRLLRQWRPWKIFGPDYATVGVQ